MSSPHYLKSKLHSYVIPVTPKSLKETLCVVELSLNELDRLNPGYSAGGTVASHLTKVRELMAECDRKRPTGSDGKHGDLHTTECGCDL
jgi:hypothetical protein